ncbi:MAG: hypothetical protein NTW38_04300 [Candidatus Aminicenantes bacterium]|nr:hypothetical protein [Candidatus Aminicenantes bacterium]
MNKTPISRIFPAGIFVLLLFAAGSLYGQRATLSISPTSISFAAADPDTSPTITAGQVVTVTMRTQNSSGRTWQLTLRANGNLSDATTTATIAISNVSWTATPSPFQAGTLAAGVAQIAAADKDNDILTGYLTFVFKNLWTYWAGSYTQTVTVTLAIY